MELKSLYCFMTLMIMSICDAARFSQLNKTPLKSIQSQDGDVIDCVHISQQPAFDHPLLKNHVVRMRPRYHPEGFLAENDLSNRKKLPITQLWQLSGSCPEKTIPIRRTKTVHILSASSDQSNLQNAAAHSELISQTTSPQSAAAFVRGDKYYGAKAIINVWEPQVEQPSAFSLSQLIISEGSNSDLNSIQAGWHVNPSLYGDNRTRLFTYWTKDNFESTGCYNLLCSGFVQTNNEITLGGTLFPLSTFNGSQFEIDVLIWKDTSQDVWWLQYGGTTIGYWPTSLFTNLGSSASTVAWGGLVFNSESNGQQTASTQMGSGRFPEEGFRGASYMRNLQVVDKSFKLSPLSIPSIQAKQPNCYNVTLGKTQDWGDFIFYGGPGRNPNCP